METVWWFLRKIKHRITLDPAIQCLGIEPKEQTAGT